MCKSLEKFEILLGITGGIAAYKSAMLCSMLIKEEAAVTVIMTKNAQRFITPLTFSTLSHRPVYTDLWALQTNPEHIALTDRADLIVIAPATANIIAKYAHGIADDLLSTTLCSADSPILLAPAMNTRMWHNRANTDNLETLRNQGVQFVGPNSGQLACGTCDIGRMAEPQEILAAITDMLACKTPKKT